MLDREFVTSQVCRLSGLRFFPQYQEGMASLVDALMTAPDQAAAERFIDEWLRTNVLTPTPADIYVAFKPDPEPFRGFKEPACPICQDSGWALTDRNGKCFAQPCACRRQGAA